MKNRVRDTNFELLRIILMIMVIVLHFNNFGTILSNVKLGSWQYFLFNMIEYFCIVAINVYILITGFYMVSKNIKLSKIINIIIETTFYSVVIYLIISYINNEITIKGILRSIIPYLTKQYWFITAYITLYILIPVLNKLINNCDNKEFKQILMVLFSFNCIFSFFDCKETFGLNEGYSVIWFCFLFLLGAYIKLYDIDIFKKMKFKYILVYISIAIIQTLIAFLYNKFYNSNKIMLYTNYNNVFILISSISLFLFFKNINIKNTKLNNIILKISPLCLAVYLIHENKNLYPVLWKILNPIKYLNSFKIIFILIIDTTMIFIICCLIEKARCYIFNKFTKVKFFDDIKLKINQYNNYINLH